MNIHCANALMERGLMVRRSNWPADQLLRPFLCPDPECQYLHFRLTTNPKWTPTPDDINAEDWESAGAVQ